MNEIWKPVKGYESDYEVSNMGNVRSCYKVIIRSNGWKHTRRSKQLKPATSKDGYLRVALAKLGKLESFPVHRLVAFAFIDNPMEKPTVNHKNGIKVDNRVVNLEWMTHSENCQHSFDTGLQKPKRGSLNGNSKLTEQDVIDIREFVAKSGKRYYGRKELAEKYGVSEWLIKSIITGRRNIWSHV